MEKEELLRSPEYWIGHIQDDIYRMVENYRKENNLKRKDIAEKLEVSKGYVSQILNGDYDHKISKLVDLALAFNKAPILCYQDLDEFIANDAANRNPFYADNQSIAQGSDEILSWKINTEQELQPIFYEDTNSASAIVIDMNNFGSENIKHDQAI